MARNFGTSILVPGVYVTPDSSRAVEGALVGPTKALIIAQKTSDGTLAAETFTQVFSAADLQAKGGIGSQADEMGQYWFANNVANQVYVVLLDDEVASTAGTQTLTITGTATAAGTIYLYINGEQIQVGVSSGDTATVIGDAIVTAVGSATTDAAYPVTSSNTTGTVTFTAKNKGTVGNSIDIRLNLNPTEELPAGVTGVVATGVSGATDPDIDDAIAAVPDDKINWWVSPFTDASNLGKLTTELDRRWGTLVQLDGQAVVSVEGSSSAVVTIGDTYNNEYLNIMDAGLNSPMPPYLWAAAAAGQITFSADADPARPFTTLELVGVIGDTDTDKRNFNERNSILTSGVSTHVIGDDGTVRIERMVSTYKTNQSGATDTAWRNTNTATNISFQRESLINMVNIEFPRHKLADDGTVFGSGQPIVTPGVMKGAIVDLYEQWILLGLTEDLDTFKNSLVVERDATDRSRLNATLNPILVGQFYILDATLQFIL
jgi:phage tail sheath gpL-like